MNEKPRLSNMLLRLREVFRAMPGVELADTDAAGLAGVDLEECRILLAVLQETRAIERLGPGVFVCRSTSWWASAQFPSQFPS